MRARYHRLEGTKEFGVSETFVQDPSSVLLVVRPRINLSEPIALRANNTFISRYWDEEP